MKSIRAVFAIFLLVVFVAGCGIPKNQYDAMVKEMSAIKTSASNLSIQVVTLKRDHEKSLKEMANLKAENTKLKSENAALKTEIEKISKAMQGR